MLSRFSCVWFFMMLWTVGCQAPLSMGFSWQKYWSGSPCPSPGDFPNPRIEPSSPHLLRLLHCKKILYALSHPGSSIVTLSSFKFHHKSGPAESESVSGWYMVLHYFRSKWVLMTSEKFPADDQLSPVCLGCSWCCRSKSWVPGNHSVLGKWVSSLVKWLLRDHSSIGHVTSASITTISYGAVLSLLFAAKNILPYSISHHKSKAIWQKFFSIYYKLDISSYNQYVNPHMLQKLDI